MLLFKIGESRNIGFIRFLVKWEAAEVKTAEYYLLGTLLSTVFVIVLSFLNQFV